MKASILDLRYKMKDVLGALKRGEMIQIFYHGKLKGTIVPSKKASDKKIEEHPFFGMFQKNKISVEEKMQELRGGRYNAL